MNKLTKLNLIYATAFAIVSAVVLITANVLGSDLILAWSFPRGGEVPLPWPFIVLTAYALFTILWICGLIAIYMIHIIKTNRIARKQKVLWTVSVLLAHILVMPVYWYLYIRPEPAAE